MYTMFLHQPLNWCTLHALSGCCRRARLTGTLQCYLFLLPWPPLFPVFLLALVSLSAFCVCWMFIFFKTASWNLLRRFSVSVALVALAFTQGGGSGEGDEGGSIGRGGFGEVDEGGSRHVKRGEKGGGGGGGGGRGGNFVNKTNTSIRHGPGCFTYWPGSP
jgi:hypothetical protein